MVKSKVVGLELVTGQVARAARLVRVLRNGLQSDLVACNNPQNDIKIEEIFRPLPVIFTTRELDNCFSRPLKGLTLTATLTEAIPGQWEVGVYII